MKVDIPIDKGGIHKIILVGVDTEGSDITTSEDAKLFSNEIPLCTKDDATSCDINSLLYAV
jgi:hypothetical protein